MTLNPGYSAQNGCLVFYHPIESVFVELIEGVVTLLVLTAHGVVRVDSGTVPRTQRPRISHFFPNRPLLDDWGD